MISEKFIWLILGLVFGSFLNSVEYSIFSKKSFAFRRSICPKCEHLLSPFDLFPLLSFAILKGKCRYCKSKISIQYPFVELLSALLFLLSSIFVGKKLQVIGNEEISLRIILTLLYSFTALLFLFFAIYDLKHNLILNKVIYPAIIFAFAFNVVIYFLKKNGLEIEIDYIFFDFSPIINLISATVFASIPLIFFFVSKGKAIGGGDIKLIFFLVLILGLYKFLPAFYLALIFALVVGIVFAIKKGSFKDLKLPFGFFLSVSAIISLFLAEKLYFFV